MFWISVSDVVKRSTGVVFGKYTADILTQQKPDECNEVTVQTQMQYLFQIQNP